MFGNPIQLYRLGLTLQRPFTMEIHGFVFNCAHCFFLFFRKNRVDISLFFILQKTEKYIFPFLKTFKFSSN